MTTPTDGPADGAGAINGITTAGLLSERSLKFYNGTYKWNTDGFEDENGVYRQFGDEPDAWPPTPRPPAPWSDIGNPSEYPSEGVDFHDSIEPAQTVQISHTPLAPSYVQPPVSHPSFSHLLVTAFTQKTTDDLDSKKDTSGSYSNAYKQTLLRDDLFIDHPNRERLIGRLEGMFIGQWYAGVGLSLEESYQMCGLAYPDGIIEHGIRSSEPTMPKQSDVTSGEATQQKRAGSRVVGQEEPAKSPWSDGSPLSDYPSGLSDMDVDDPFIKGVGGQKKGKFQQAAGTRKSGRRGANSTPVNAKSNTLSMPTVGYTRRNAVGFNKVDGDEDSDPDSDKHNKKKKKKNKTKNTSRGNHDDSKIKKRRKDDSEDDKDKENDKNGTAGPKENTDKPVNPKKPQKSSKQTTFTSRKTRNSGRTTTTAIRSSPSPVRSGDKPRDLNREGNKRGSIKVGNRDNVAEPETIEIPKKLARLVPLDAAVKNQEVLASNVTGTAKEEASILEVMGTIEETEWQQV